MHKRIFTALALAMMMFTACENANTIQQEDDIQMALKGTELSSIQDVINNLQATLREYKTTNDNLTSYINDLRDKLDGVTEQNTQIKSLTENLTKEKADFEKQIKDLQTSVDNGSKDVKAWVEKSFETKEALVSLQNTVSSINTSIKTISGRIEGLETSTKEISGKLEKSMTEISKYVSDIDKLKGRVDNLEKELSAFVSAVQSIVVIPDYSDGSVKVSNTNSNKIYFEVYPVSAAEKLAAIGKSCVSLDAVETISKASEGDKINIPVSEIGFDGKYMYVIADGTGLSDDIKNGVKGANASLRITDGKVTRSSKYFQFTYVVSSGKTITVNITNITENNAQITGFTDVRKTSENDMIAYGLYYTEDPNRKLIENEAYKIKFDIEEDGNFSYSITGQLMGGFQYRYIPYVYLNGVYTYGEEGTFTTPSSFILGDVTDISRYGATIDFAVSATLDIKQEGSSAAGSYRVIYSKDPDVMFSGNYEIASASAGIDGTISGELHYLDPGCTYYYLFRTNLSPGYTTISEIGSFTTPAFPEYVDLGLSVKWATTNIGATNQFDLGNVYKWGELTVNNGGYYDYRWYVSESQPMSKYNGTDNILILEAEDDVATVVKGSEWRTPTAEEWNELYNASNVSKESVYDPYKEIHGVILTSKKEGFTNNAVFIPCSGNQEYWTSSLYTELDWATYTMNVHEYYFNTCAWAWRLNKLPVRAVK